MSLFKKIDALDNDFPEDEIERLSKEEKKIVEKALNQFFNEGEKDNYEIVKRRWTSIREMIFSLDERIRYWENRRTQFLQLSTALLAASILAIVTILPRFPTENQLHNFATFLYSPILIASLILFLGSIRLLVSWNKQNNPNYPFSKGYRVWRWHYRHAEKRPLNTDIEGYSKEIYKNEIHQFAKNLTDYKIKTLNSTPTELFDQDLTQLYLLLINEKFKVKFVNKLRDSLVRTLNISWIISIGTIAVLVWSKIVRYGYLF